MKFLFTRDIGVPAGYAFARATDFAAFERRAIRAGAELHRLTGGPVTQGSTWSVAGTWRGRYREGTLVLEKLLPPDTIAAAFRSGRLDAAVTADFVPLSRNRCRLELDLSLFGRTLQSRMLLQSLRLVRGRVRSRIDRALDPVLKSLESDYASGN